MAETVRCNVCEIDVEVSGPLSLAKGQVPPEVERHTESDLHRSKLAALQSDAHTTKSADKSVLEAWRATLPLEMVNPVSIHGSIMVDTERSLEENYQLLLEAIEDTSPKFGLVKKKNAINIQPYNSGTIHIIFKNGKVDLIDHTHWTTRGEHGKVECMLEWRRKGAKHH